MTTRLIFVYNADAGIVAGIMDSIHKALSPSTYQCSLCAITYGGVGMKRQWRDWLEAQPFDVQFYHRPDFRAAFPAMADKPLPTVMIDRDDSLSVLLGPGHLAAAKSIDGLIAAIGAALAQREA